MAAAGRWVELLSVMSFTHAKDVIGSDARFTDMPRVQYGQGLELLRSIGMLNELEELVTAPQTGVAGAPKALLAERLLEHFPPAWLALAESSLPDPSDLPFDGAAAAAAVGLSELEFWSCVQRAAGKVDAAERAAVGLAGEEALVRLIQERYAAVVDHVSLRTDALGYDLVASAGGESWHVEVKSFLTRRGLAFYLSRHEFEVARRDPCWRLAVVGLNVDREIDTVATVPFDSIVSVAPDDRAPSARWDSAKIWPTALDLEPGLAFLEGKA